MDEKFCFSAWNCRNRKFMCDVCNFNDKYKPKISQAITQTVKDKPKFRRLEKSSDKES